MFIFSLPEVLQERKKAVKSAIKNMSDHSNRVLKTYLKLDNFFTFEFPHNFFPTLLQYDEDII